MLAYILHRRTQEGYLDSLAPASARDAVHLHNARAPTPASSGDPALDEFRAALADART